MQVTLPQGQFVSDAIADEVVVLVAGGRPPATAWLQQVAGLYPVWAIDRGADVCRAAGVRPERLFGDADSGSQEAWQWAESLGIPVERYHADKDRTDLQLALQGLSDRRRGSAALLTGGMGRRFDHALSNVYSLLGMPARGPVSLGLADEAEALFLIAGGQTFQASFVQLPKIVSLLPLSPVCEGVCSRGVRWPLDRATLRMDEPGGISNRLAEGSRQITVSLGSGYMGIYFCWEEKGL